MSIFQELRKTAEKSFAALPLPASKDENYRFLGVDDSSPALIFSGEKKSIVESFLQEPCEEEAALLFVNGEEIQNKTTDKFPAQGIIFTDMLSAEKKHPQLLQSALVFANDFSDDLYAQLAKARFQNGVFLHVAENTKLEAPLRVVQWKNDGAQAVRNVIVLEKNAELSLVEEYAGIENDNDSLAISVTEIMVKEGAKISYFPLQHYGKNTNFFHRLSIRAEKNAQVEIYPISVGAYKGQYRFELNAVNSGASFLTKGAARGSAEQQFDFWVNMNHTVPETTSALDYWFVMGGKSKAIFNGMIRITKAAKNTVAYQKCRSLLLSSKATVHAIPKLEIATDEVKCNHGASISTVNPEQVHYLQARGIPRSEAEKMIIRGFTEQVLEKLPTEALYTRMDQYFTENTAEVLH